MVLFNNSNPNPVTNPNLILTLTLDVYSVGWDAVNFILAVSCNVHMYA